MQGAAAARHSWLVARPAEIGGGCARAGGQANQQQRRQWRQRSSGSSSGTAASCLPPVYLRAQSVKRMRGHAASGELTSGAPMYERMPIFANSLCLNRASSSVSARPSQMF